MQHQRKIELLAPAKNLQTGITAINHGADAVYIGAAQFGARQAAGNSIEDIAKLASELLGPFDSTLHAECAIGEHELRAVGTHQLTALLRHRVGHNDDRFISARRRHRGESDAGVARGGLDYDRVWLE